MLDNNAHSPGTCAILPTLAPSSINGDTRQALNVFLCFVRQLNQGPNRNKDAKKATRTTENTTIGPNLLKETKTSFLHLKASLKTDAWAACLFTIPPSPIARIPCRPAKARRTAVAMTGLGIARRNGLGTWVFMAKPVPIQGDPRSEETQNEAHVCLRCRTQRSKPTTNGSFEGASFVGAGPPSSCQNRPNKCPFCIPTRCCAVPARHASSKERITEIA